MNVNRVLHSAIQLTLLLSLFGCAQTALDEPGRTTPDRSIQTLPPEHYGLLSVEGTHPTSVLMRDGTERAIGEHARLTADAKWLSISGKGYQTKYRLDTVKSIKGEDRRGKLLTISPADVCDPGIDGDCGGGGGDCDPSNPDLDYSVDCQYGPVYIIEFPDYGGSAKCKYYYEHDGIACDDPANLNTGDGYKGNVWNGVYTFSVSKKETKIGCNAASSTNSTEGTFEYTEYNANEEAIAFSVVKTGPYAPNSPSNVIFTPASTAESETAGLFLYIGSAIGPAAACSAAFAKQVA